MLSAKHTNRSLLGSQSALSAIARVGRAGKAVTKHRSTRTSHRSPSYAGAIIAEVAAIASHTIGSVSGIIDKYGLRDEETPGNAIQKWLDREGA